MMRLCVGMPADAERIVWSDGSGRAACGADTVHGAHTFGMRHDDVQAARRASSCRACRYDGADTGAHVRPTPHSGAPDCYAAPMDRPAERAADAEYGTPCIVCGAPVNSDGAGHDDGCILAIADCPSCGAGTDAGRCDRCARYGTHGSACRHAHLAHRCMRT